MSAGNRPILSNIPHDMTQPMIKSTVDANNRHNNDINNPNKPTR